MGHARRVDALWPLGYPSRMLATFAAHVSGDELRPIDNVWLILSKPDNIPIILLLIGVSFYTWMSLRSARRHDKLIAEGRKKDVLRAMQD
jgi:hypothetical protein